MDKITEPETGDSTEQESEKVAYKQKKWTCLNLKSREKTLGLKEDGLWDLGENIGLKKGWWSISIKELLLFFFFFFFFGLSWVGVVSLRSLRLPEINRIHFTSGTTEWFLIHLSQLFLLTRSFSQSNPWQAQWPLSVWSRVVLPLSLHSPFPTNHCKHHSEIGRGEELWHPGFLGCSYPWWSFTNSNILNSHST